MRHQELDRIPEQMKSHRLRLHCMGQCLWIYFSGTSAIIRRAFVEISALTRVRAFRKRDLQQYFDLVLNDHNML